MEDKKADLVFTDPPYGVNYASKNAFLNEIDEGNRIQVDICGDHQSALEMKNLWTITFKLMYEYSRVGACYYICSPQGGELMMMMMMSIKEAGWNLKHTIVWVKNNFVLGRSDYNYKHEPLLYGWKDTSHKFYGGTNETSVWEIDKLHRSDLHPTMKPVELVTRALTNSSVPGETVIDFFLGSGTTLVACEQLNRVCYGIELTPHYCDVILSRWAKLTDKDPVRDDGIKWSEL
jgi:DNA modification methylase